MTKKKPPKKQDLLRPILTESSTHSSSAASNENTKLKQLELLDTRMQTLLIDNNFEGACNAHDNILGKYSSYEGDANDVATLNLRKKLQTRSQRCKEIYRLSGNFAQGQELIDRDDLANKAQELNQRNPNWIDELSDDEFNEILSGLRRSKNNRAEAEAQAQAQAQAQKLKLQHVRHIKSILAPLRAIQTVTPEGEMALRSLVRTLENHLQNYSSPRGSSVTFIDGCHAALSNEYTIKILNDDLGWGGYLKNMFENMLKHLANAVGYVGYGIAKACTLGNYSGSPHIFFNQNEFAASAAATAARKALNELNTVFVPQQTLYASA